MPIYGPDVAQAVVLTFRDGILSSVGHDLVLRVTAFEIEVDPSRPAVRARFDPASLRVAAAFRDGRPVAGPTAAERRDIERTAATTVLHADRHPEIRFESTAVTPRPDGWEVRGQLTLAGRTGPVVAEVRRQEGRRVAEARLHQPDFGVKPYSAMLGGLRVKPDVVVRISIPEPGA